ncbi:peptidoglycan DD-metalloendopeptidase family protein [Luteimonas aquatica]|uniref:peptidoglycan DD-metalloendopeptidase family protein n=1 Tax=Luteimonas aquatica TaxID=450364 RepID=UPI001F5633C4|nr:peptidoglycan DD-metalloendopeptidase family protein [Luteimonas aquatica]
MSVRPLPIILFAALLLACGFPALAAPNFKAPYPCGQTWSYYHHGSEVRQALDFDAPAGTPVLASAAGYATQHYEANGAGNYVVIDHGGGWKTYYFHLQSFSTANGATVGQGQRIGLTGNTGNSFGAHIHYEQLLNGAGQVIAINGRSLAPYPGGSGVARLTSDNGCGGNPAPAPRYWVDTYATAPGFGSPTSTAQTGSLYAGTNYVYCKTWGREVRNGTSFNHWWLKTDLDVGPANQWISAYYLDRWGNDEARDNDGFDLPRCEVLPYGKIGEKYYALGGTRSVLGVPKLAEMDAQLGGRFQQFNNGIILWHKDSGAFAVRGAILDRFWATGGETRWGFAMMDEADAAKSPATGDRGRFQYFQRGLFLWSPRTAAHVLHGAILDYFEDNGREERHGYPTGDEAPYGETGRKQAFEKATFYWTPERGVWVQ